MILVRLLVFRLFDHSADDIPLWRQANNRYSIRRL